MAPSLAGQRTTEARNAAPVHGAAWILRTGLIAALVAVTLAASRGAPAANFSAEGAVDFPAFRLPQSELVSAEALQAHARASSPGKTSSSGDCQPMFGAIQPEEALGMRRCYDSGLPAAITHLEAMFPTNNVARTIGGVHTEVITPRKGVAAQNQHRVLINLHGGGFGFGARLGGEIESIPVSVVSGIRVISVDYRLAPEASFPAASEDVAAVYQALLKEYPAKNIGIYGCSAGGWLTAQSIAWFQKQGLPMPGAVAMECAGAMYWYSGDSGAFWNFRGPGKTPRMTEITYLDHANPNDPLVQPVKDLGILAKFPPSLLISSTRDLALSSVAYTHSLLVKLGVEAELHVWADLPHDFFSDPDLPESRDVYDVVSRFFDRHLGR